MHPPPWSAGIPAYIFLGGLEAGSGLIAAGAAVARRPILRRNARVSAIVAVALGGVALVEDLGRPERALNMMRTAKLTSPMSVGSWILAGFGAFSGAALAIEVVRRWLPSSGGAATLVELADGIASAGAAFFAPPLAAYTAVLLADTATPLWHESYRELPFVFVSSATAAAAGLAQITTPISETGSVRIVAIVAAAADLTADALLARRLGDLGRPLHEGKPLLLHRAARALTAAGAIGSALVGGRRSGAIASGLALLAGSACTRFAVFEAGMESARDPEYTIRPQRARAQAARDAGRGVTQPGGDWPT